MRNFSRRDLVSFGDDADPIVHIASLLVQATPGGCAAVRGMIGSLPGAELHETRHSGKMAGKLVIVLESADSRAIANAATELQQLPGVLTVSIVAHMMESAAALEESHEPTTVPAA